MGGTGEELVRSCTTDAVAFCREDGSSGSKVPAGKVRAAAGSIRAGLWARRVVGEIEKGTKARKIRVPGKRYCATIHDTSRRGNDRPHDKFQKFGYGQWKCRQSGSKAGLGVCLFAKDGDSHFLAVSLANQAVAESVERPISTGADRCRGSGQICSRKKIFTSGAGIAFF